MSASCDPRHYRASRMRARAASSVKSTNEVRENLADKRSLYLALWVGLTWGPLCQGSGCQVSVRSDEQQSTERPL